MPVTEIKENRMTYVVTSTHPKWGAEIVWVFNLTSSGSAYWVGGKSEPWSLEVDWDPVFEFVGATTTDIEGNDKPYFPDRNEMFKMYDKAVDLYWEMWTENND